MTTDEPSAYDFEYKGWRADLQSQMAPDGKRWYARVVVMREEAGGWKFVPLEFQGLACVPDVSGGEHRRY